MENYNVYEDVANRFGGDIYVGVVGPVRTGKSTFIKQCMKKLVIPFAKEENLAEMTDELPQSSAGRTIMTTEPKFVPKNGAKIPVAKGVKASVRFVDCVGFAVEGANGFEEDGAPRLVKTPWSEQPMPFEAAATLGTEKVIKEHSTIGVLITTDGSVTDIPRENYVAAEERAVQELKGIGKPFVIVLNCQDPSKNGDLVTALEEKYKAPMVAMNVERMEEEDITSILQKALFEFPVLRVDIKMPTWVQSLPEENEVVAELLGAIKKISCGVVKMRDCFAYENMFTEESGFLNPEEVCMDLGRGSVEITVGVKRELFLKTLSYESGESLLDDYALLRYVTQLSRSKREYDKVKDALQVAEEKGYGVVFPKEEEYALEKPKLVKKGMGYGVEFKASAPSYHIVKIDVTGSINPIIGTEQQGEEFVAETLKTYEEGDAVWETNIFGKNLRTLMGEELAFKNNAMPTELQKKLRRTVSRIVNDGKGNLICILF